VLELNSVIMSVVDTLYLRMERQHKKLRLMPTTL
jgi:hypothetical protein